MAAYTKTVWTNDVPPALSAANLNHLTDELEAQAQQANISHTLPNWRDGASPALTDSAPLNEMERILQAVAQDVGLSYTPTVWSVGWTPARNAARFNKMEAQAAANRTALDAQAPPPVPVGSALQLPAKFHIWGGNESSKGPSVDVLVCSYTSNANPNSIRSGGNPRLKAYASYALNPAGKGGGFSYTYGGVLTGGWGGVNDTLSPNPQNQIRGWQSTDAGCVQPDNLQGIKINNAATATWMGQVCYYAYKLGNYASLGYDGPWSDNMHPEQPWAKDSACGSAAGSGGAWDNGYFTILNYMRLKAGANLPLGGNVVYRSSNATLRAKTNMAMRENLNNVGGFTESSVWSDVQQMQTWLATPSENGLVKIPVVNDIVAGGDQNRARFGWAVATIGYEAAYNAYDGNHTNTFWPTNVTRGYLGRPTGPIQRSGGIWTRTFEHGTVTANWNTKTGTFA